MQPKILVPLDEYETLVKSAESNLTWEFRVTCMGRIVAARKRIKPPVNPSKPTDARDLPKLPAYLDEHFTGYTETREARMFYAEISKTAAGDRVLWQGLGYSEDKIPAIRNLRQLTGCGLKFAKKWVEQACPPAFYLIPISWFDALTYPRKNRP